MPATGSFSGGEGSAGSSRAREERRSFHVSVTGTTYDKVDEKVRTIGATRLAELMELPPGFLAGIPDRPCFIGCKGVPPVPPGKRTQEYLIDRELGRLVEKERLRPEAWAGHPWHEYLTVADSVNERIASNQPLGLNVYSKKGFIGVFGSYLPSSVAPVLATEVILGSSLLPRGISAPKIVVTESEMGLAELLEFSKRNRLASNAELEVPLFHGEVPGNRFRTGTVVIQELKGRAFGREVEFHGLRFEVPARYRGAKDLTLVLDLRPGGFTYDGGVLTAEDVRSVGNFPDRSDAYCLGESGLPTEPVVEGPYTGPRAGTGDVGVRYLQLSEDEAIGPDGRRSGFIGSVVRQGRDAEVSGVRIATAWERVDLDYDVDDPLPVATIVP